MSAKSRGSQLDGTLRGGGLTYHPNMIKEIIKLTLPDSCTKMMSNDKRFVQFTKLINSYIFNKL